MGEAFMPVYEYFCPACQIKVGVRLSYAEYGVKKPVCPVCGGKDLRRKIGRVRIAKSEDQRLDSLSDPSAFGDLDENDPKSLARAMKKMGKEMGEDLPPEFDEITGRLEAGESPEAIEKEMPELGGGVDAGGGDGDL
jgi:putative FmdB family regulatory protein